MSKSKNVKNLIMNVLPDNRPVTSLQIVEDHEKCPKNFTPIHRTYDQDADADLWRETYLFGKRTGRYLCLSKSEGLPEYIVETLRVIGEREMPPEGFSLLSRTADSELKAWRKRQIAYKLSKRNTVSQAITDIILCSRLKAAPQGFSLAGEINGIVICFKLGNITHRQPPSVPTQLNKSINDLENTLHYVNISSKSIYPLPPTTKHESNDYEQIRITYQLTSPSSGAVPVRAAPKPPTTGSITSSSSSGAIVKDGTLNGYTDIDGVPFVLNPHLNQHTFSLPKISDLSSIIDSVSQYDFQLERQILCTTKTSNANSTNPFF